MNKYIATLFFISTIFHPTALSKSYSYKTFSNSQQKMFQEFCKTTFQDYVTTEEEKSLLNGWTVTAYLQSLTNKDQYSYYISACYQNNKCIGFQTLRINPTKEEYADADYLYNLNDNQKDYKYAFIEVTFIKPEYRRQGIASKFLNMTYKKCKDLNICRVVRVGKKQNIPTIHFYNKFQFTQLDPTKRTLSTRHTKTNDKIKNGEMLVFEKILD